MDGKNTFSRFRLPRLFLRLSSPSPAHEGMLVSDKFEFGMAINGDIFKKKFYFSIFLVIFLVQASFHDSVCALMCAYVRVHRSTVVFTSYCPTEGSPMHPNWEISSNIRDFCDAFTKYVKIAICVDFLNRSVASTLWRDMSIRM